MLLFCYLILVNVINTGFPSGLQIRALAHLPDTPQNKEHIMNEMQNLFAIRRCMVSQGVSNLYDSFPKLFSYGGEVVSFSYQTL